MTEAMAPADREWMGQVWLGTSGGAGLRQKEEAGAEAGHIEEVVVSGLEEAEAGRG
jgi:hypothetical protein